MATDRYGTASADSEHRALFLDLWLAAFRRAGRGTLRAGGSCMIPVLRPGQAVTVERCAGDACRVGDVVVYRGRAGLVAHRVVATFRTRRERRLVHKGDQSDVWAVMSDSAVLGRVVVAGAPPGEWETRWLAAYYALVAALGDRISPVRRVIPAAVPSSWGSAPARWVYASTLLLPRLLSRIGRRPCH